MIYWAVNDFLLFYFISIVNRFYSLYNFPAVSLLCICEGCTLHMHHLHFIAFGTLPPAAPNIVPSLTTNILHETTWSATQKYYVKTPTTINYPSSKALLIRKIQPSINNQCTGINRTLKLFT